MLSSSQAEASKYRRKKWCNETDQKLIELVRLNGPKKWEAYGKYFANRTGKQCRERWVNQLNPMLKQGPWSIEESLLVFILQTEANYNNQWSYISKLVTCRTDGQIKNLWRQHLQPKQEQLQAIVSEGITKLIQSKIKKTIHKGRSDDDQSDDFKPAPVNSMEISGEKKEILNKIIQYLLKRIEYQYIEYIAQKKSKIDAEL